MISEIQIKNCASFDYTGITVKDLKEINFIYGANGTGKTTLANVIAEVHKYPQCTITWRDNTELKSFVYNRQFIDENFGRSRIQKGIFTLGKGEKDAKERIEALKSEIEQINTAINSDISAIELQNKNNELNEVQLTEDCWKIYTPLKDIFKPAFKGCAFKATFKERCKAEINNSSPLLDLAVLKEKATMVYSGSNELMEDIGFIDFNPLQAIETDEMWGKRIIGKEDVNIAALIRKLKHSDWVKQGMAYYSGKDDVCPFCQQKAPDSLEDQLNEYFDETYLSQIKALNDLKSRYVTQIDSIIFQISELISSKNSLLNLVRLEELNTMLTLQIKANKDQIEAKIKEPGSIIYLESLTPHLDSVNDLVLQARERIALHNDTVKNLARESARLTGEVWRYITEQLKPAFQRFRSSEAACLRIIESLEMNISQNEAKIKAIKAEIAQLEIMGTNTAQTKTEINALLNKYGFTGFQLSEAPEEKGYYQMVRFNGERVERSLSEGEKTFITFLYFYHLLKGSTERDAIHADRIVVFDDPVSNLDGDTLYIVNQLIRKLIAEIRSKSSTVRQLILLTHNVYFHQQVSYQNEGESIHDETFWILRKEHGFSQIRQYDKNPISSPYELLWREVKENPDSLTLDLTLQRIIEEYFKALGGINTADLLEKLDPANKTVAAALLSVSLTNETLVLDDLNVPGNRDLYLKAFKNIFDQSGQMDHYQLMMGIHTESSK